ncbi:MAG: hypothetical protein GWP04_12305 [Gammaproteobacteria bacterium]|nr:hypothetical protein [Gammaproteobacteria bacterium]
MNERDIFDAEVDPADGIDPIDAAQIKTRVRARVLTHTSPHTSGRRRVLLAVAIALLALAAIAATFYLTRQPTQIAGIGCAQDLTGDAIHVITPTGGLDPQQCASLWADGTITNPDLTPVGQIPPLVGCVNDTGTLIVIPTDDQGVCERLGMAVFAPPSDATSSIIEVQDRLIEQINPQVCPSFDDARRIAEEALADAGIDDWTVAVSQPRTDERPCPSLSFDSASRRILLVPIDRTDR